MSSYVSIQEGYCRTSGWECVGNIHTLLEQHAIPHRSEKIWLNLSNLPNQIQNLNVYPLTLGVFPDMGEKVKIFVYGHLLEDYF